MTLSKIYWQMALHAIYCSLCFGLLAISMSMLSQINLRHQEIQWVFKYVS